jgi:hypothetical protein
VKANVALLDMSSFTRNFLESFVSAMQDLDITVQRQSARREDQTGGGVAQDDRNKQLIRFPIIIWEMGSDRENVLALSA